MSKWRKYLGGSAAVMLAGGAIRGSLEYATALFDEATVLRVGDAYERATPWRDRRPEP